MKLFDFKYSRQFIGIFLVFMGTPLLYFFKEVLGFGGSSTFTVLGFFAGFALMLSKDVFSKFYRPNVPLFRLAAIFTGISLIYFFAYNDVYSDSYLVMRDSGNYLFIFIFFYLLLTVPNEVKDYFLPIVVVLTFIGSVCLIYSIATNPYFILGQRATVVFGDGTTTTSGNPHVYARNAFAGIFASYFMFQSKNLLWKFFCAVNILLSAVVLILAQARSILLSFMIAVALFCYYNISGKALKSAISGLFKPKNFLIFMAIIGAVMYFLSTQYNLYMIVESYFNAFSETFVKALLTAFGLADEKQIDHSALGRVGNLEYFKELMYSEPYSLILGKGYRFWYMDMPIIEALLDYGIIGFWSFGMMNLLIFRECLRAMKAKDNVFTMFLAYFYITYFVGLFTGGRPNDTPYWFVFAVMIRFMGIKYLDLLPKSISTKPESSSPVAES